MTHEIHLGFEVGTGKPVSIPLRHLIITGQTRLSGKTTTLDAIASRAGLRALTFLTKPGEETFENARRIPPYFHDQGGWRFTASVLEATLGEKLKRERAEIINASKGTRSLKEVYRRIVDKKSSIREGFVKDVLTALEAYLEIVLPQLERTPFADSLDLDSGVNLIDMSAPSWSDELRALVIRSALEWVLRHEKGVFTVIPEAWQYIPEGRGNPVKQGCENLIRMGGVHSNWVGIDSQEITSVDKGIAKSCGVWILGVQRELNEVKRVIAQLPGTGKPKPDEVMGLGLGEFFVSYTGSATRKVYVQPAWMEEETARQIAMGKLQAHRAGRPIARRLPISQDTISEYTISEGTISEDSRQEEEEDEMASEDVKRLEGKLDDLMGFVKRGMKAQAAVDTIATPKPETIASPQQSFDEEALFQRFKQRLLKEPQVLQLLTQQPEIRVEVKRETIAMDGSSLPGRLAQLIANGFFKTAKRHVDAKKELERTGPQVHNGNLSRELKSLVHKGFLTDEGDGYYLAVPGMKVHIVERRAGAA